jgi:hypothetical protein
LLRPSNFLIVSCSGSTPSTQRILIDAMAMPFGALASPNGPAAALRTEMMPDAMGVECVGRELLLRRLQGKLFARHEGQEMATLHAQGAIAFDDFLDRRIGLELESDPSAMASPAVMHDFSSWFREPSREFRSYQA